MLVQLDLFAPEPMAAVVAPPPTGVCTPTPPELWGPRPGRQS